MTNEEKELLLKDLCSRLPHGVKVRYRISDKEKPIIETLSGHMLDYFNENCIVEVKPYLRPMSSMTENEYGKFRHILSDWFNDELFILTEEPCIEYALSQVKYSISPVLFDWLNGCHFDYRGLIEKNLALEAPGGMYAL